MLVELQAVSRSVSLHVKGVGAVSLTGLFCCRALTRALAQSESGNEL